VNARQQARAAYRASVKAQRATKQENERNTRKRNELESDKPNTRRPPE
jgi:hypothetical protein